MKHWFEITLSNLLIAAVIGVLLRYAFVNEIPFFEYKYWLHAHSHLAMLGWVYLALFTLVIRVFIPVQKTSDTTYRALFRATQLTVWGMLIAFIIRGYWAVSISFLIAHVLLSYMFVRIVWSDIREQTGISVVLLRMSLVFLVISTIALWSLPVFTVLSLRGTEYYYMAIQFFLHFQFNGWFTFCVLALLFRFLESKNIIIEKKKAKWFVNILILSCFFTYALAVAWSNPLPVIFVINSIGVSLQFLALLILAYLLYEHRSSIMKVFKGAPRTFIFVAVGFFALKVIIQAAVVLPALAKVGYTIRNFVIGFIHLIQLGVVTMAIFGFAFQLGFINRAGHRGAKLVLAGFLLMELLLFVQGILLWTAVGFMPFYYEGLVMVSAMIAIGILWILLTRNQSGKVIDPMGTQSVAK